MELIVIAPLGGLGGGGVGVGKGVVGLKIISLSEQKRIIMFSG